MAAAVFRKKGLYLRLQELAKQLKLVEVVPPADPDIRVSGGYVSDLLSDVMGRAAPRCIWVTGQSHPNVVAVAVLTDIAGIIIANGIAADPETIKKASEQGVALYSTPTPAYTVVGQLFRLGIGDCTP